MKNVLPLKLRLVQIGFGNIGMRRTRITNAHPGIELVGIVDVKPDCLTLAREVTGDRCVVGTDYVKVIQMTRPHAVIISTPNYLHAPMTMTCLELGVHVLCEKPLAISVMMASRCVDYAHKKKLKLKVGANHRFWRGVRQIIETIEQGTIGTVERVEGEIGYLLPDIRSEWYREKEHSGGGTIIDNCPHLIDVISQILSTSGGDRIQRVRCTTTRDDLGYEVEDRASGVMLSRHGRTVTLKSTWSDGDYRMNLEIQGSKGRLKLSGFERLTVETEHGNEELDFSEAPPLESWGMDVQTFVDAILLDRMPLGTGVEGLNSVRVIDALYQSAALDAEEVTL